MRLHLEVYSFAIALYCYQACITLPCFRALTTNINNVLFLPF